MMKIDQQIKGLVEEVTALRHDFHRHPELLYDVHRTAGIVADKLREFGVDEVIEGIGRTGVVGVIRGRSNTSGRSVALRADMDALPIEEQTNRPYASRTPGKMHACGHDGHTAMLLGTAKHLAQTRDFDGTVIAVFQPAEEGGGGARAMIEDGLTDRFGVNKYFALHSLPGVPVGQFATREGPIMAATAQFDVVIEGKGAHAAMPSQGIDPVVVSAQIISALQTISSRSVDPLKSVVVSVTSVHAGSAYNVIPAHAELKGTIRFLDKEVGAQVEERFRAIVEQGARMFGARASIEYRYGYPVTVNHANEAGLAVRAASVIAEGGRDGVREMLPTMGAEDFSYMLESRPGAFVFIGNGDSAPLHNPAYDFNDEAIPYGIAYFNQIVRSVLPAG
jgi:hippurate hydrolase